ncbi:MAG: hypothetical protein JWO02_4750 [Solirubrobacterales bacterium]|nr:hypothetical protein [Solirubrobacterales bacterium]
MDGLAARLGRAVMLEDPRLRLIAYSQTDEDVDPVRLRSILRRESPEDVRAWLFEHGLHELRVPTLLPPVDDLGMRERLCCPVRHEGALLGYLWVLGGTEDAIAVAAPVAEAAGAVLYRRRLEESRDRAADVTVLERAVFGAGAGPVAVVRAAGLADGGDVVDLQAALEQALRRRTGGHGRCLHREDELVLAGGREDELRDALVLAPKTAPSGLGEDLHQARRAAQLAQLLGATTPLALGDVPLEAHLLEAAGDDATRIVIPGVAVALLEPAVADLRTTIETYLDVGGDVQAAVAALHISRAGLYRRLHRAEQLAGIDLHDGAQRTLVHLALKAARLRRD